MPPDATLLPRCNITVLVGRCCKPGASTHALITSLSVVLHVRPPSLAAVLFQTEAETPDAWIGLVREPRIPGNVFGPTQRAILVEQFHRSFFGPGGLFWRDDISAVGSFLAEIEASTYATILAANTGAPVSGNVFLV